MKFFENGKLYAGCNYWASHAGIYMWSRWDSEVVDKDFKQLSEIGIELVAVRGGIEGLKAFLSYDAAVCPDDSDLSSRRFKYLFEHV